MKQNTITIKIIMKEQDENLVIVTKRMKMDMQLQHLKEKKK